MIKKVFPLALAFLATIQISAVSQKSQKDYVPRDVVWTSQSHDSSESMPCGGHSVGLNVWVEQGDLLFYACQSGWFDENNTLLKAGRWRLHIDGQPFNGTDFTQRLCLDEGCVYVKGGGVEVRLWVDVDEPVVFVTTQSQHTERATLSYESWRYRDRLVTKNESQQTSWKWILPKDCYTFADTIRANGDHLEFSHRNREETVFDYTVHLEQLDAIKDSLYNPIGGLLMEGEMNAPGFRFIGIADGRYATTGYRAWQFRNDRLRKSTISISLNVGMPISQVSSLKSKVSSPKSQASSLKSKRWWHQYWQRSWIVSDTNSDSLQTMLRNYELMRYMLGCNAKGQWPTKFNGGLFTFDPQYVFKENPGKDPTKGTGTPDYRRWGGGTMTAQNQRLVYWPMLRSGDYDALQVQIDTYRRMLPNAVKRTRQYWGHGGASFTEQMENFGLPNPAEYGNHTDGTDPGVERNEWLEYTWDTALEFALMEIYASKKLQPTNFELATEVLRFFSEHYQWQARQLGAKGLDEKGHLVIYPGSACETYKMAYNPSSTIAALKVVSEALQANTSIGANASERSNSKTEANASERLNSEFPINPSIIPDIPLWVIGTDSCIAPALAWNRIQNEETTQLYPVWPWRVYGLGRPHLDIARNTYLKDPWARKMHSIKGWKQDNIWAACLGLTDEARRLNTAKLANGPYRFTAFWEPGFDWAPDHNRGGAAMVGLQEMLLQETPSGELLLFPAWPKEWNCRFRLHTLEGKPIEAIITNGEISR